MRRLSNTLRDSGIPFVYGGEDVNTLDTSIDPGDPKVYEVAATINDPRTSAGAFMDQRILRGHGRRHER